MTALLAILSAVFIGSADFVGGIASRTANGVRVAAFAAVVGLPLSLVVSAADGAERVGLSDVIWSVLAGVAVAVGLGCFYLGMGRGLISVVAPVAAVTGAVIPVAYALARGERPGVTALVGLAVAFLAVAVVSVAPSEQHAHIEVVVDRNVIVLSLASGLCFGLFDIAFSDVFLIRRACGRSRSSASPPSIVLALLVLLLTRGPIVGARRLLPDVLATPRSSRSPRSYRCSWHCSAALSRSRRCSHPSTP